MSLLNLLFWFLTIDAHDIVILVSSLVGASGFFGGIVALLKLRPEAGQIVVSAAQGALIVQGGVIDALNKELARVKAELELMEEENENLRKRLAEFEKTVASHTERITEIEKGSTS